MKFFSNKKTEKRGVERDQIKGLKLRHFAKIKKGRKTAEKNVSTSFRVLQAPESWSKYTTYIYVSIVAAIGKRGKVMRLFCCGAAILYCSASCTAAAAEGVKPPQFESFYMVPS